MHRVSPPSKPPDGGYPPSFCFVVGGTQLCGSWYLSAVVRLQGFSSCSPVASLRRRSPKMVTSSSMEGESEPGCGLRPSLSLKDFHHQGWGGECAELGSASRVCGGPLLPSVIGGKGGSRPWRWQLHRARLSELSGFGAAPGAAFRHGSWKRFRRRRACRRHPRTDLQLYGLLPVLASRVWGMGEGLLAAASALRSSLLLFGPPEQKSSSLPLLGRVTTSRSSVFCCSAGPSPIEWGCSYLRRWNRSSICNGTSDASVFVHCGRRGLNMYVFSARSRVFSSFSSTKTRLLVVCTTSPSASRPV
jgi:hypothetical protein